MSAQYYWGWSPAPRATPGPTALGAPESSEDVLQTAVLAGRLLVVPRVGEVLLKKRFEQPTTAFPVEPAHVAFPRRGERAALVVVVEQRLDAIAEQARVAGGDDEQRSRPAARSRASRRSRS